MNLKLLSIVFMGCLLAFANASTARPVNYWYGGLVVGGDSWQNSKTATVTMASCPSGVPSCVPGQTLPLKNQSDSQYVLAGGFVIGAAQESSTLFLAEQLELLYQTVDNEKDQTANSTATFTNHIEETQGPTAVIALLPGIVINRNWVAYAKLGYAMSQFESDGNNAGIFGPNGDQSELISGMQLGLGLQRHFPKRWTLRLEYDYTNYGSFTLTGKDDSTIPGGAGGVVKTKYAINTNAVMLNAVYSF